jgi:ATP-dependent DNA helicase RecQ
LDQYQQILTKYWGFSKFKPLQEDIIKSVDEGKDTLALMHTGGGKSITFQVPGMYKDGICLVITPLIALMKDQVDRLIKLGVKAMSINSSMNYEEIKIALDNCIYGGYKFLYCSPERIQTELFQLRVKKMNVNLIAVDEAHCISQWGYDFRPSYLKISDLRKLKPEVPFLALTATATPDVVKDIQNKLDFKESNVLRKSFERKNLVYWVVNKDDKQGYLIKLLKNIKGSGIIYVRTRKKTRELSVFLKNNGFKSDYYNGGLTHPVRESKQNDWQSDNTRIMVATNAFGMGIDKADVRAVVHWDLPDTIEQYYQEAGRAGRDGRKSYAILLYNDADILNTRKRIETNFPEIAKIKRIYNALCNYFKVPIGEGKGVVCDFNIASFAHNYKLNLLDIHNAIRFLQYEGYLEVTDDLNNPSRIHFTINRDDLYKFQVANAHFDSFIKLLLRCYTGVFTGYVKIDEDYLAKLAGTSRDRIYEYLKRLGKMNVISYIPQKKTPLIIFTEERLDDKSLVFSRDHYKRRKKRFTDKIEAMIDYGISNNHCRSQILLRYFGENDANRCGQCDYCQKRNKLELSKYEFDIILNDIKKALSSGNELAVDELVDAIQHDEEKVLKVLQWLIDNDKMHYTQMNKLKWCKKQ